MDDQIKPLLSPNLFSDIETVVQELGIPYYLEKDSDEGDINYWLFPDIFPDFLSGPVINIHLHVVDNKLKFDIQFTPAEYEESENFNTTLVSIKERLGWDME